MTGRTYGRRAVHDIIFDELCCGVVDYRSRQRLKEITARGLDAGSDSVILGCTELCLLLAQDAFDCPVFDSTTIHAAAAVAHSLGSTPAITEPALTS